MSSLHTINTQQTEAMQHCSTCCTSKDAILFFADGVVHTLIQKEMAALKQKGIALYALSDDLIARGLPTDSSHVQAIDYDRWVDLTESYKNSVNWS
ncbi:sulfurtransferase complex subunit TusB [uncultured Pseudoteredinibacter sp.]|uniref:sulfurtransferase complex subunit TusB n=1 Tax=uncultured Pseudoteredinibacter sp. TaxID=1641701 RepID=UPI002613E838|nr:sulfurtransferase complex subunit TusB [uncultured Pseudoteredinibacter sp.]